MLAWHHSLHTHCSCQWLSHGETKEKEKKEVGIRFGQHSSYLHENERIHIDAFSVQIVGLLINWQSHWGHDLKTRKTSRFTIPTFLWQYICSHIFLSYHCYVWTYLHCRLIYTQSWTIECIWGWTTPLHFLPLSRNAAQRSLTWVLPSFAKDLEQQSDHSSDWGNKLW